jgi:hypothetical protein
MDKDCHRVRCWMYLPLNNNNCFPPPYLSLCDVCIQIDVKEEAEEVRQARRALELLELAKKEAQVCLHHWRLWWKGEWGFGERQSQCVTLASPGRRQLLMKANVGRRR